MYSFIRQKTSAQPMEENRRKTELVVYWRKTENGSIAELFDVCIYFSSKTKTMVSKNICNTCFSLEFTPLELPLVRSANRLMLTDKWILADKCWRFVWKYRTIDNVAEITLYQKPYQKYWARDWKLTKYWKLYIINLVIHNFM